MIYAVNKRTKEHQVVGPHSTILVPADADGWIKWGGGECPLPGDQLCEVNLSYDLRFTKPARPAKYWEWKGTNLVAYRPILDDKPHAPEWDGEGLPPVGTVCEYQNNRRCPSWKRVEVTAIGQEKILMWDYTSDRENHLLLKSLGNFRPIRTNREKWIDQATDVALQPGDAAGNVYDALKSGELPQP